VHVHAARNIGLFQCSPMESHLIDRSKRSQ
jgi:hypothetical protein